MKKRIIFLLALAILILPFLNAESITGETITGQAASKTTNVSVFVLPAEPVLQIISPLPTSYQEGEYILLDYSAVLIDTVWYNIDNGPNVTINSSFYFQPGLGTHTLYLFGNQSNGTVLSDNVTFSVNAIPTGGGGGGGGGGTVTIIPKEEEIEIVLEKEIINVELKQNQTKKVKLLVVNNEQRTIEVSIKDLELDALLTAISQTSFTLNPGQSKEIYATFSADIDRIPGLYFEKLMINAGSSQKEVTFYIEVESSVSLFDVEILIEEEPAILYYGDNLVADIKFYNLGKEGDTEVEIEYTIKKIQDSSIVFGEKQTVIIGTSTTLTKIVVLPEDIKGGDYIFYVRVLYEEKTASSSRWFKVIPLSTILPVPVQKLADALEKDGPYLAIAIFTLTTIFVITTAAQIIASKYGWLGVGKKQWFFGAGKRRTVSTAPKVAPRILPGKRRLIAGAKKRSEEEKSDTYKKMVRHSLKKIKKNPNKS